MNIQYSAATEVNNSLLHILSYMYVCMHVYINWYVRIVLYKMYNSTVAVVRFLYNKSKQLCNKL